VKSRSRTRCRNTIFKKKKSPSIIWDFDIKTGLFCDLFVYLVILHRFVIWIGAAPDAGGLIEHIAFLGVVAAAGIYAWHIRKKIDRVNQFGFECHFVPNVVAIMYLDHFPFFLCHILTPDKSIHVIRCDLT